MNEITIRVYLNPKNDSLRESVVRVLSNEFQKKASEITGVPIPLIYILWITPDFTHNAPDMVVDVFFRSDQEGIWQWVEPRSRDLLGSILRILSNGLVPLDYSFAVNVYPQLQTSASVIYPI